MYEFTFEFVRASENAANPWLGDIGRATVRASRETLAKARILATLNDNDLCTRIYTRLIEVEAV